MYILICGADLSFGKRLAQYVENYYECHEIAVRCKVCGHAEEALELSDLSAVQIAFFDTEMDSLNGIELARRVRLVNPGIIIVYISSNLEFALEGYTVNAFRFILKKDVERQLPLCLEAIMGELACRGGTLSVRKGRDTLEIPLGQIYYLESDRRRINVCGDVPRVPLTCYYGKLAQLPDRLFQNGFLRISRSHVVNMAYLKSICCYKAEMVNGVILGVSRKSYAETRDSFLEWKRRL